MCLLWVWCVCVVRVCGACVWCVCVLCVCCACVCVCCVCLFYHFVLPAGGHLEVLKYAHENGCPWDERTSFNAVKGGHWWCSTVHMRMDVHENGCSWDERHI